MSEAFGWNAGLMDQTAEDFQATGNAMVQEIEQLGADLISRLQNWDDEGKTNFDAVKAKWSNMGTEISRTLAINVSSTLTEINQNLTATSASVANSFA